MKASLASRILDILVLVILLLPTTPALAINPDAVSQPASYPSVETSVEDKVTLITGDTVTVTVAADGKKSYAVAPAEPNKTGQNFLTFEQNGNIYVLPSGVDLKKLDIELFNIDYLINEKYDKEASLPLLVSYLPTLPAPQVQSLEGKIRTLGVETNLFSGVSTFSTRLAYSNIATSYRSLSSQPEVVKIWLDRKVHAQLAESVPLIGAPDWWATGYNGTGVKIAILDTGIDSSHPALDDLDDNTATVDPKVMMNVNFTDDPDTRDLFGHGTHVAGIAAGTRAGSTNTGVAPGAKLWNVKVLNRWGSGSWSWIINGINFASLGPDGIPATGDEADIINMSLGGYASEGTDPVSETVNQAADRGTVVVIAAGNSGSRSGTVGTPGIAEKAITVGASDKYDVLAEFSSRGPTPDLRIKPDILAPGVSINSSVTTNLSAPISDPSGYKLLSGTSMATPHVVGAAALMLQRMRASGSGPPAGLTVPQAIKYALMSSAKDLGYNVYEQGSGRLDLTYWTQGAGVLVSPASLSLGQLSSTNTTISGNFTFITVASSANVTLSANLTDALGGAYPGRVTFTPASFTLPAWSQLAVGFSVNLTALPASLFSGKVTANISGNITGTIHAIFGFGKLWQVNINKIDVNGNPAQGHWLWVLRNNPVVDMYRFTGESGNYTFYLPDGSYDLMSPNWGQETEQTTIWTIAENVSIAGDTTITLDERNTKIIDFNPNKPGQMPSAKSSRLYYWNSRYGIGWRSDWWLPGSFITRVSPFSAFDAGFYYNYYPQADFRPDQANLVNTGEWHNLLYSVGNITDNTTLVADYNQLVHRHTMYSVALDREPAYWRQWSWDDVGWWSFGFEYLMDAPQVRSEWLSPQPVRYSQYYGFSGSGIWKEFDSSWWWNPAGEYNWGMGGHPLTSGVDIWVGSVPYPIGSPPPPPQLIISGYLFRDTANNNFESNTATGHIKVTRGSDNVVLDRDISYSFGLGTNFEGTANYTVELWGQTPLRLSKSSYTRLDFLVDQSRDFRPPKLRFAVPGINPFGVAPAGTTIVKVEATDESLMNNVRLSYSLGDNENWTEAGLLDFTGGWWVFNLGELNETLVNITAYADDSNGNSVQQAIYGAFYVGVSGVTVSINAPIAVPPGGNFTATVGIRDVLDLDAANYDVSFNATVLRLDNITAGNIGGTIIPVDMWAENITGRYKIVQNVPGLTGVNGTGSLAVLHFNVLGSLGESSSIELSNGVLSNVEAHRIPASWLGDLFLVAFPPGDANEDGNINSVDITKVERIIAGFDPPTSGADANLDTYIDALDITKVERIIAGLD